MIRKVTEADREKYLQMTEIFYNSDAVLHPISEDYRIATFNEILRSDEYADCYFYEEDKESARSKTIIL